MGSRIDDGQFRDVEMRLKDTYLKWDSAVKEKEELEAILEDKGPNPNISARIKQVKDEIKDLDYQYLRLLEIARSKIRVMTKEAGVGKITPWGIADADNVETVSRGLGVVDTSGHGGVFVSAERARKQLPAKVCNRAIYMSGYYWFEQDVDWILPLYFGEGYLEEFQRKGEYRNITREKLQEGIKRYFPGIEDLAEGTHTIREKDLQEGDILTLEGAKIQLCYITDLKPIMGFELSILENGKYRPGKLYKVPYSLLTRTLVKVERKGKVIFERDL